MKKVKCKIAGRECGVRSAERGILTTDDTDERGFLTAKNAKSTKKEKGDFGGRIAMEAQGFCEAVFGHIYNSRD